jgi:hypothetical protein
VKLAIPDARKRFGESRVAATPHHAARALDLFTGSHPYC